MDRREDGEMEVGGERNMRTSGDYKVVEATLRIGHVVYLAPRTPVLSASFNLDHSQLIDLFQFQQQTRLKGSKPNNQVAFHRAFKENRRVLAAIQVPPCSATRVGCPRFTKQARRFLDP